MKCQLNHLATADQNVITINKVPLTFHNKCMNEKDPSEIDAILSTDFVWQSAASEHKTPSDDKADKKETIQFTLGAEIQKVRLQHHLQWG